MLAISYIALFILLLLITVQDFRFRAINWIWIPLLFALLIYKSSLISNGSIIWQSFWQNSVFIAFQLVFLIFYFSLRNKKVEPVINSYLGAGDLLFFIAIAPSLCFGNFLLFLVVSLLVILSSYSILSAFKIKTDKQIPLAGLQSAFLLIWLFSEWCFVPQLSFTYLPIYFAN